MVFTIETDRGGDITVSNSENFSTAILQTEVAKQPIWKLLNGEEVHELYSGYVVMVLDTEPRADVLFSLLEMEQLES